MIYAVYMYACFIIHVFIYNFCLFYSDMWQCCCGSLLLYCQWYCLNTQTGIKQVNSILTDIYYNQLFVNYGVYKLFVSEFIVSLVMSQNYIADYMTNIP